MSEAERAGAAPGSSSAALDRFFLASYLLILFLCLPYLRRAWRPDLGPEAYALALGLAQAALYLAPAFLVTRIAHGLLLQRREAPGSAPMRRAIVAALALLLTTLTAIALEANARIFEIFGFHLNGFVLNLLTTPGGIDSMGIGREGVASFASGVAALAAVQGLLLWGSHWIGRASPRKTLAWAIALLLSVSLAERVTYAIGEARSDGSILEQANAFPFYLPITARNRLIELGIATPRKGELPDLDPGSSTLAYPLHPLRVEPPARPLNVVWLVGESLRWDLLDPAVMPATHALSRDAWRFTRHYSGGNGTRMGMFSMFYGVHGPYWFQFLAERRSPVLIDLLQQQGYQLGLFTSARFSYPEFDRTIFARVPGASMTDSAESYHSDDWGLGWKNDRARVSDLLGFLEKRDRERPFFAFMFFESTHFRYYFPDESVIRRPYSQEVDIDELGGPQNAELEYARYVNAAHHLDSQIGRVLDALRREGSLDDTIVLITGDHGEEFWEKGRKGHNSEFHEEQIRVPLVLWIPGDGGHVVDANTSHVDIVPTLLPLLGVENPAADYSLGRDLRGPIDRNFMVVADWSRIGILDPGYKLTLPIRGTGLLLGNALTTRNDGPLPDQGKAYRVAEPELRAAIEELHRFRREPGAAQVAAPLSLPAGSGS
jgi:membrane-anchored protein YejM (alkaline phosphatase superfamily)